MCLAGRGGEGGGRGWMNDEWLELAKKGVGLK